ncbi:MAG TPA: glycoside hydrolase family 92 protein, partial [Planctomycetaceae bacterium]|nr:glycoside hydrolase family 92 protein [Planctomycetaceae bacterium]
TEIVHPGYHRITLDDYGVQVELTSTDRVGFHRWTFRRAGPAHILFDLGTQCGPARMADALIRRVGATELEGYVTNAPTRRRPKPCTIFFVARFDRPFAAFGGWQGDVVRSNAVKLKGKGTGAFVRFAPAAGDVIQMKLAISYVSAEQARKNLQAELPHWDFDRVRRESRQVWNDWLGRIEVHGGTPAQRTRFYTDLWHVLLGRHMTSDVNGKYCDMTGPKPVVRQIPLGPDGRPKYAHFNGDAFWTTFWNINIVWSLAYPDTTRQWVNFLVDMYKDGGLIPRGPSGHNYTFVMIAAHSTPFIVGAYMKGLDDFDVETQ